MGSLAELQKVLRQKDDRIRDLERQLRVRDERIQELTSQLDKYQSIVHLPASPSSSLRNGPRKQRAQGISAEPQMQGSLTDIRNRSYDKVAKSQR